MIFHSESELVSQYLENESTLRNRLIITELETNFGRPDIVMIYFNPKTLKIRREKIYKQSFLRKYSYILSYLFNKGWVSLAKIKNFFPFTEKELKGIIEQLEEMQLIDTVGSLVKSKASKDILVIKRIRVIEAKLSNWKNVIEQAERHLWFSKESSILLPNVSKTIIDKSIVRCNQSGLGLYIVDGRKNIELLKPSKGLVNTPLLWELNEKLVKGEL
ncbi:hypothetical protein MOD54_08530 [Bacillus spizizenii]|nr:hypothetical protein [Bacillus spizizenii]MCY8060444.1 hypothetical protein [Bacillus spizizenii]MCY8107308.1 hypothetical protein [Bacillus spizizenii]MCY8253677.1 hypothetical protein [Bacillus spizizenii]MCY8304913.1 hypothetical protein [Bacillus spizizenii]